MKKIIGIVLIIGAIVLGYFGLTQFKQSTNSTKIGPITLEANDKGGQTSGYIMMGLSVVAFIGGVVLVSKKD